MRLQALILALATAGLSACVSIDNVSGARVPCEGHERSEVWGVTLRGANLGCLYLEQKDLLKRYQEEDGLPEAAALQLVGLAQRERAEVESTGWGGGMAVALGAAGLVFDLSRGNSGPNVGCGVGAALGFVLGASFGSAGSENAALKNFREAAALWDKSRVEPKAP